MVEALQRHVAAEFGLPEAVGLAAMRAADQLLPGDPEVSELSLYRKFNRCIDGNLNTGDLAPDAALIPLQPPRPPREPGAEATSLHALLRGDRAPWQPVWPVAEVAKARAAAAAAAGVEETGMPARPLALLVGSYT